MKKLITLLKKVIKRILPPPVHAFMREITGLHGRLDEQQKALVQQKQREEGLKGQLEKISDTLTEMSRIDLRPDVRELQNRLTAMETRCTALEKCCTALEGEVTELRRQVLRSEASVRGEVSAARDGITARQYEMLDPALYPHVLQQWYRNRTGKLLDLEDPKTFNEKVQWMKLYHRDALYARLADKVQVREWVREKAGEKYLVPLLAVYDTAADIDFDALPDQFVLKANHGCAWNAVVRDKTAENLPQLRRRAAEWLRTDFSFRNGFELHYGDIPRKLLAEEYLADIDGDLPDYKFWCFDGRVAYVEFLAERSTGLKGAFFDRDWNRQDFVCDVPPYEKEVERPAELEEMIALAETLSREFSHVRVDLYRLSDGTVKFGELTFSTGSGVCRWFPEEADARMGALWTLPEKQEQKEIGKV